jgi:hypothetical protein
MNRASTRGSSPGLTLVRGQRVISLSDRDQDGVQGRERAGMHANAVWETTVWNPLTVAADWRQTRSDQRHAS